MMAVETDDVDGGQGSWEGHGIIRASIVELFLVLRGWVVVRLGSLK